LRGLLAKDEQLIVVNGLRACDTCRKALTELRATGRETRLRDLRDEPPSEAEVAAWHAALGEALLNRRSTTWRGLDAAARAGDPVSLMVAHPTLIKRPVVEAGGASMLGWTAATRSALGL
jgi:arsenate reductase